MTMGIRIEFRIFYQIVTLISFDVKTGNPPPPPPPPKCLYFGDDCVPNGSTGKVAAWGVLIYSWNMTFSDKMLISFKQIVKYYKQMTRDDPLITKFNLFIDNYYPRKWRN